MAFSLLGFILMYFVTGFLMQHAEWLPQEEPKITTIKVSMDVSRISGVKKLSKFFEKKYNIRGKKNVERKNDDGSYSFEYLRPGYKYFVYVPAEGKNIELRIEEQTVEKTIATFHRLHRYGGDFLYDIYIFMMDLASIALIVFAITGIYMWYKLAKRKAFGFLILAVSISYTSIIIYLLMTL